MTVKPTWNEYFLNLAEAASIRSGCVRAKVGAVLVKDHRVLSIGYNDSPAGEPGCEACPRRLSGCPSGVSYDAPETRCNALHAEMNAILYSMGRSDTIGATLYCTAPPCYMCSKVIAAAGIKEVITP